jgi:hypothetical protein
MKRKNYSTFAMTSSRVISYISMKLQPNACTFAMTSSRVISHVSMKLQPNASETETVFNSMLIQLITQEDFTAFGHYEKLQILLNMFQPLRLLKCLTFINYVKKN